MAKKDGKRVSDVVNSALKAFIAGEGELEVEQIIVPLADGSTPAKMQVAQTGVFVLTIDDDGEVTLAKNDVMELQRDMGPFRIESSGTLIFEKDIDSEALRGIEKIVIQSGEVKVPRKAYPLFLTKCQIKGKLEKY